MTFYVRAARRRATLGRERGASPLLSVRRYISLAFELAPLGGSPTGVDRLGEACEACPRGFLAGSGSGSFWQVSAPRFVRTRRLAGCA